MKELQEKIRIFNEERDWDQFHSPENLAKSISIEAGELLECFQWNNNYDLEEVKEELADVMNYCIQMADRLGVDPKQIILDKMEKTAKKYPVDKAKGVSTKYTKLNNNQSPKDQYREQVSEEEYGDILSLSDFNDLR